RSSAPVRAHWWVGLAGLQLQRCDTSRAAQATVDMFIGTDRADKWVAVSSAVPVIIAIMRVRDTASVSQPGVSAHVMLTHRGTRMLLRTPMATMMVTDMDIRTTTATEITAAQRQTDWR